jgi:hypothetical protein
MNPPKIFLINAVVFFISISCSFCSVQQGTLSKDSVLINKIAVLKKALKYEPEMIRENFNLACCYSLIGEPDSAFTYLNRILDLDYNYIDLLVDPDLQNLTQLDGWNIIVNKLRENWLKRYPNGDFDYAQKLLQIQYEDQVSRSIAYDFLVNFGAESQEYKQQLQVMRVSDSLNFIAFKDLIEIKGWPDVSRVGDQMTTVFLIIVHSDLETMRTYYPNLKQSVNSGDLPKGDWATFIDKLKTAEGQKQIYGTQLTLNKTTGKYEMYPVEDEETLNERRKSMGLNSIEAYLKHMFEQYNK